MNQPSRVTYMHRSCHQCNIFTLWKIFLLMFSVNMISQMIVKLNVYDPQQLFETSACF